MKKNLIFREILLYAVILDIALCLTTGFVFDYIVLKYKALQYVGILARIFLDYLLLFYLWYPVRYENYKENNPDSHILEWTVSLILEVLFCVLFSNRVNKMLMILSLICLVYIFIILRYVVFYRKGYDTNETELAGQMKADIPTLLPLIGCLPITAVALAFTQSKNNLEYLLMIYLWLLIICSILYCVHVKKYIICEEVTTKKIRKAIIHGAIIFIVVVVGLLLSKISAEYEYVGVTIYFALIEILLIMLFINNLSNLAKEKEIV